MDRKSLHWNPFCDKDYKAPIPQVGSGPTRIEDQESADFRREGERAAWRYRNSEEGRRNEMYGPE